MPDDKALSWQQMQAKAREIVNRAMIDREFADLQADSVKVALDVLRLSAPREEGTA